MDINSNHSFILLSKELINLCEPLKLFDIHHFTYLKKYNDGSGIALSNNPQWIQDYYTLNLYTTSLFEKKPSEYESAFYVWFGDYDLKVYQHGRIYYNTTDSITISEPNNDSCEHYLFSTSPGHQQAIHFLENNRDILYRFILYLKDRGAFIFKTAQKNKLTLCRPFESDEIVRDNQENNSKFKQLQIAKNDFLKNTPIYKYILENDNHHQVKLSQREIMCISHLLKNRTAEETAKLMNLSRRTVESYLDNIKIKMNCHTKIELIKKLQNNKYLLTI